MPPEELIPTPISSPTEPNPTPAASGTPSPAPTTPPAYTDFTLPQGHQLDPALATAAKTIFRDLGLDQAQAQKLVDLYGQQTTKAIEAVSAMRQSWRDEVARDPAMAGKETEIKAEIGRALTKLPAEVVTKFKEAMDFTGAGDHPAFVRAFYELAKQLNEGRHVPPGNPSPPSQNPPGTPSRPDPAASMYPTLPR